MLATGYLCKLQLMQNIYSVTVDLSASACRIHIVNQFSAITVFDLGLNKSLLLVSSSIDSTDHQYPLQVVYETCSESKIDGEVKFTIDYNT